MSSAPVDRPSGAASANGARSRCVDCGWIGLPAHTGPFCEVHSEYHNPPSGAGSMPQATSGWLASMQRAKERRLQRLETEIRRWKLDDVISHEEADERNEMVSLYQDAHVATYLVGAAWASSLSFTPTPGDGPVAVPTPTSDEDPTMEKGASAVGRPEGRDWTRSKWFEEYRKADADLARTGLRPTDKSRATAMGLPYGTFRDYKDGKDHKDGKGRRGGYGVPG